MGGLYARLCSDERSVFGGFYARRLKRLSPALIAATGVSTLLAAMLVNPRSPAGQPDD